ncbi:hypothetical protein pdam_00010872 [Pocillopora damicornis]|uniref:CTCHY-type domain-containing protein n=1 Tax=Pocillopora damicornis TaxID=46731 RepID=A0A3M6TM31_POCDA|nr:hypothetical protein pdam_00010872 [Pocillopora damicornis]
MEKTSLARKERFQNRQKERNQSEEMSSKGIESDRSQNSAGAAASNRQCELYQHLSHVVKKFAPCNLCHKNSGCRMLMAKKEMRVLVCARFVDIGKRSTRTHKLVPDVRQRSLHIFAQYANISVVKTRVLSTALSAISAASIRTTPSSVMCTKGWKGGIGADRIQGMMSAVSVWRTHSVVVLSYHVHTSFTESVLMQKLKLRSCPICRYPLYNRSFHCDVFNVCLDKRLEGRHSSRENSGHDERWLCLERLSNPAMLTKVRREYAVAMIWNGM